MSKTIQINPRNTEQQTLDKRIYKVKLLVNGSINTIYVFNGKKLRKKKKNYLRKYLRTENLNR